MSMEDLQSCVQNENILVIVTLKLNFTSHNRKKRIMTSSNNLAKFKSHHISISWIKKPVIINHSKCSFDLTAKYH